MWSYNSKGTKLDLSKVRSDFKRISDGNLTLIVPKKNVWDWSKDERFLRSVVIDNNGYVVSCSWPKFGNFGEFTEDTKILEEDLEDGSEVRWSHKEDGSLCIRSVINNKVILRTRGTLYGGESNETESYKEKFFRTANKYPKLLDPNWMNDRSLLFEYVAPDNLVIITYTEEDLIFLGFVYHNLQIGKWKEVEEIAKENNLNLVRLHNLPRDPIKVLEIIKTWKEEGVVARCNKDQIMVKVKSAHYLAKHRMKFSINYKFMVEFAELSGIISEEDLINELKLCDYDFEIIEIAIPFFYRYKKSVDYVNKILKEAKKIINSFSSTKKDKIGIRKDLAISISKKDGIVKSFVFLLYDNKLDRIQNLRKKIILNEKY